MQLYFIRHGRADRSAWSGDDFERPLTPDGRDRMEREIQRLRDIGLNLDRVITSPLTRAVQTAEVVASGLGMKSPPSVDDRLGFGFDLEGLRSLLKDFSDDECIALVGHEPSFSSVIGELIGGGYVVCKKGCVARVDLASSTSRHGELVWLLQPKTIID